jgi:SynChlorMet cassette radical SAM/SPASM protein ScmE
LLKKAGFPVTVRVTLNRHNVDDLENVARLLLEEVGLSSFSTNEAYACGATDRTEDSIILTPAQRQQAMLILTRLADQYDQRIQATAGPLIMAREFKTIDYLLTCGQTTRPGCGTLSACGGVFAKLAVHHDGTIIPCHLLSTLNMGTIGIDSLQDVWLNHPILTALRQRQAIPLSTLETCKDCTYQGFCRGGCPGGAVYASGDFNTRNPMDCYRVLRGEDPYMTLSNDVNNLNNGEKNG